MRLRISLFALAFALGGMVCAETVSGPVAGLVHDGRTSFVRPILGIAGAATIGPPITTLGEVRAVASSPLAGYSLIVHGDSPARVSVVHADGRTSAVPLADAEALAISHDGRVAAAWSGRSATLSILGGLPDEPVVTASQKIDGNLSSFAVSDLGHVISVVAEQSHSAVWSGVPGNMHRAGGFDGHVSVGFAGRESFVAVFETNQLFALSDPAGGRELRLIADGRDGLNGPAAVGGTSAMLIVANQRSRSLALFRSPFAKPDSTVEIPVQPDRLTPVSESLYALNGSGPGPLYLFDARRAMVFFVPADVTAENQ